MAALLSPPARQQFFIPGTAVPAAGFKLFTYATGTTTPLATYKDRNRVATHTNPIILDANGQPPGGLFLELGKVYDYSFQSSTGDIQWTQEGVSVADALGELASVEAGKGAALLAFLQTGVSSAVRTVLDKLHELPSVMDKIPVAEHAAIYARTSTYDCTAAIQAAVNDYPCCTVPSGLFNTSGTITIPAGHELIGAGPRLTTFQRAGAALSFFILSQNSGIERVGFTRNGTTTATSGRLIDCAFAAGAKISDIYADHCWDGIYIKSVAGMFMDRIYMRNWQNAGINMDGGNNDIFLDQFLLTHIGQNIGTGIRMHDKIEALVVTNGDVIGGNYGLTTSATGTFAPKDRANPNFNKFTNVFFDSSVSGNLLEKAAELTFQNCWFATAQLSSGVTVGECADVVFDTCDFVTNGSSGARLSSPAQRGTKFVHCKFLNNNYQENSSNGLTVDAGVSDWSVIDCTANNSLFSPTTRAGQGHGIFVAPGASDRYVVACNNLTGNTVSGMSDGGTGTNKKISGNIGYTPPFTALGFTNAWTNFGTSDPAASFWKDEDGFVHLRGRIKSGTMGATAAILPPGFRPSLQEIFAVSSNGGFGEVQVRSTGEVVPSVGSNVSVSLAGISFRAA
jgi:hypothetical protein